MGVDASELGDVRDALPVLLRWRPVGTDDAAELLGLSTDETAACLTRLSKDGYVVWDGAVIGYQSPELRSIAEVATHLLKARRELDGVERVLQELPMLVESWATNAHADDPHVIEVVRGPVPMAEIWTRQLGWEAPARVSLFMPQIVPVEAVGAEMEDAGAYLRAGGVDVRVIIEAAAFSEADRETVLDGIAPSAHVRIHPSVPSWMMVSDGAVALPIEWGRSDPVDLVLVAHRPTVRAMTAYFDLLWDQSITAPGRGVPEEATEWAGLLSMLERGTTVEAAGRALGLSPRTAQRRVRAAMAHYRVRSQFALGTAWARDGGARSAVPDRK